MRSRVDRRALAALGVITFSWGFNWVVMKTALVETSPFLFGTLRYSIGGLVLLGVLLATRRPLRGCTPAAFAVGALQTTGSYGLVLLALLSGAAGKSAVLCYTMPFWVALFAWPLLGEKPGRRQLGAVAAAGAGLALLLTSGAGLGSSGADWLALAAGVTWGLGAVLTKRLHARRPGAEPVDPLAQSFWQTLAGALSMSALLWLRPGPRTHWTPAVVGAVLYNGLVVAGLGWWLWLWVLERLEAGVASLGMLATPVFGVLCGVAFLGERPAPREWLGIALIVAGLSLLATITREARA